MREETQRERERDREREREMGCFQNKHSHKSSVWETHSGAATQNIGTLHINVVLWLITVSGAASLVSTAIAVCNCQRQKRQLVEWLSRQKDSLLRSWGLVVTCSSTFVLTQLPPGSHFVAFQRVLVDSGFVLFFNVIAVSIGSSMWALSLSLSVHELQVLPIFLHFCLIMCF
jgi:hypothetical protein